MTLPNIITVARLLLVPLVVVLILNRQWQPAFLLFVAAGVSDALDGFLAKRFGMASELGAWLDPAADKALIVSIYLTLAAIGAIPAWLAGLVVARDLMIVLAIAIAWLKGRPVPIAPIVLSKLNTAAQLGFAALMLGSAAYGFRSDGAVLVGQVLVAVLTLASISAYFALWLRHMAR